MKNKHYDINYLENSRVLLEKLKQHSYQFFQGINKGTIVDLGCGAGRDVTELANILGLGVNVIGIDHDKEMLAQAKTLGKEIKNASFILSEAYPLPFSNNTISGFRAERVFQHLVNPNQVLKGIFEQLETGAPLVILETDWQSLSFYTEFVETEKKINNYLTSIKVNNGFAARKLTGYLEATQFRDIKFDIHPFVINSLADANDYFWIEKVLKEVVLKAHITKEEFSDFYNSLVKANSKSYFSCSINLVLASCIK